MDQENKPKNLRLIENEESNILLLESFRLSRKKSFHSEDIIAQDHIEIDDWDTMA
jgi:hypothetical protein